MMRKTVLVAVMMMTGFAASAFATPFADLMTWNNAPVTNVKTYTQTPDLPAGSVINNATLEITHSGYYESLFGLVYWKVDGDDSQWNVLCDGQLTGSLRNVNHGQITDTFALNSSVLDLMNATGPAKLVVRLDEMTYFKDRIYLSSSVLKGDYSAAPLLDTATKSDYSAVPEPGSMMLLGTGLVGFAGMIIRRKA